MRPVNNRRLLPKAGSGMIRRPGQLTCIRKRMLYALLFTFQALFFSVHAMGGEPGLFQQDHGGHGAAMETMQQSVDPAEWVVEKTGSYIALDEEFLDEKGEAVTLREIIDRPTLLLPVYYYCPRSCSFDLANLAEAVTKTSHPYGSFKVIALSFNEVEPPEAAAVAKPNYTALLREGFDPSHWPFLTGSKEAIHKLTDSIGYRFKKQSDHLFIHPSAMVALDKEGKIIKYIYGSFIPGDVDLAIAEAARGTPATSIKRFLAFCFNYSPQKNLTIFNIMKLATTVLLAGGLFFFIFFILRKKKQGTSER